MQLLDGLVEIGDLAGLVDREGRDEVRPQGELEERLVRGTCHAEGGLDADRPDARLPLGPFRSRRGVGGLFDRLLGLGQAGGRRASSSAWAARQGVLGFLRGLALGGDRLLPGLAERVPSPVAGVAVAGVGSDAGLTGVVWAGVAPAAAGVAPAGVVVSGMVVLAASWRKGCLDVRHRRRHGGRGSRLGWCAEGPRRAAR